MFNLYKNINQLNYFKSIISNQEFTIIYNIFKTLSFIQIYHFFKIIEIKLKLFNLCLHSLNLIFKLNLSKKNLKNFFLFNCIYLLKNKCFIKTNVLIKHLFFNINSIYYYKEVKFLKKILTSKKFLIIGEIYKNYKGSIIPFNISKLSWFVRAGLKTEEN